MARIKTFSIVDHRFCEASRWRALIFSSLILQRELNPWKHRALRGGQSNIPYLSAHMREINANVIAVTQTSNEYQGGRARARERVSRRRERESFSRGRRTQRSFTADQSVVLSPHWKQLRLRKSTPICSHGRTPRRAVRERVCGASSERTQRAPSKINRPMATGTRA